MNIMDFEVQRERRTELLRKAESRYSTGSRRTSNRRKTARWIWKLAGAWVASQ